MKLSIGSIRTDGGTQSRATLNDETTRDYMLDMLAGAQFPPITVFYDGAEYWLADGFHRVQAARQANIAEIEAQVIQGTRRDAVLHSVSANATHGLRRTNEDKRRAVLTLLTDPEWTKLSDREIARRANVSQPFVSALRAKQSDNVITPSDELAQLEADIERSLAQLPEEILEMGRVLEHVRAALKPDHFVAWLDWQWSWTPDHAQVVIDAANAIKAGQEIDPMPIIELMCIPVLHPNPEREVMRMKELRERRALKQAKQGLSLPEKN